MPNSAPKKEGSKFYEQLTELQLKLEIKIISSNCSNKKMTTQEMLQIYFSFVLKNHALQPDGDEKLEISKASFQGKRKPAATTGIQLHVS